MEHAGEIVGFRQWITRGDAFLESTNTTYIWKPGTNTARCLPRTFTMPGYLNPHPGVEPPADPDVCDCGLYALHDLQYLKFRTGGLDPRRPCPTSAAHEHGFCSCPGPCPNRLPRWRYVTGVVVGWGEVYVAHEGWRAQYARIAAFASYDELDRKAAAHYGALLVDPADLAAIALEFGDLVPEDLRPGPIASLRDRLRRRRGVDPNV